MTEKEYISQVKKLNGGKTLITVQEYFVLLFWPVHVVAWLVGTISLNYFWEVSLLTALLVLVPVIFVTSVALIVSFVLVMSMVYQYLGDYLPRWLQVSYYVHIKESILKIPQPPEVVEYVKNKMDKDFNEGGLRAARENYYEVHMDGTWKKIVESFQTITPPEKQSYQ